MFAFLKRLFAPKLGQCRGCGCAVPPDSYECAECCDARQW